MKEHSAQNEKIFESTSEQRLSSNRPALYDSLKLGSVAGPVIQANGRLSFEDDLRCGCLLYCVSQ